VTIVVATRNEPKPLSACLEALRRQTVPCEVIVADGGNDTATQRLARETGVHRIENPERIAATGWNAGIRASTSEVVGIMSSHAAPAPDYVERCLAALRATNAWAVGGRIARRGSSGPTQEAVARATSSPFGVGDARHNYSDRAHWVETAFPGMWPRWVLERVGMFDPELVRNQDDELSVRIRQAGGRIWYDPAIVVEYEPRDSLRGVFQQYRQYGYWKVRVYGKHRSAVRPRQLVPAAWLSALAIGAVGLLTGTSLRWLLLPAGAGYGAFAGLAAARLGGRSLGPRVAAVLVAIHLGYGLGMWQGAVAAVHRRLLSLRSGRDRSTVDPRHH